MSVIRTDPRRIREVIATAQTTNPSTAAREHGVHHRTVWRWCQRAAAHPGWPTDGDVSAWDAVQAERATRADKIERGRVRQADYLKRRYLAGGGRMQIDPTGTSRRLQALCAIGWTGPELAARLGVSPARVNHLTVGHWNLVHRAVAAKVAALYDELSMTVPTDPDVLAPRQIRTHARARKLAAKKGWAPPLAWDDHDLDDPAATPDGVGDDTKLAAQDGPRSGGHLVGLDSDASTVAQILGGAWSLPCSRADKVAVTATWLSWGRSLRALEKLTGWNSTRYSAAARTLLAERDDTDDGEAA
ncbi:hypothetical protein [Nocardioides lentus]